MHGHERVHDLLAGLEVPDLGVLDDHGVRPPVIAAGINLFGGPLGLLHRHITGAIPIRRHVRYPGYLIPLKAYVAELLNHRDFMFYIEGGRSYSGELKPAKTGLFHAALQTGRRDAVIVPTAISSDLVLEDHVLARQRVKRHQRPFSLELAEMVLRLTGSRSKIVYCPLPTDDPMQRRPDIGKARAVLNWEPKVCLEDGLKETIAYFRHLFEWPELLADTARSA